MRRAKVWGLAALLALSTASRAGATAGPPSQTDDFLERYAVTNRFRSGKPEALRATPDGRTILFLRSGPRDLVRDLYEFDVKSGRERLLLTARTLLGGQEETLTPEEKARRERQRLVARGFASFEVAPDGWSVLVPLKGSLFLYDRHTGAARELKSDAGTPLDPRFSPDGRMVSCVRNGEIYMIDISSGREARLTSGAGGSITHGLSEFVAQEEMDRPQGYWWSPDSKWIVFEEVDTKDVEPFSIMDPTHPEVPARTWPYPRPGHPNAAVRLGLIPASGGDPRWIDWDHSRFEYLTAVQWTRNAPLTILLENREQTSEQLFAVSTETGALTPLLEEQDPAWLNLDARMPVWLEDGSGFLWTTERNGAKELELHRKDGALESRIGSPSIQQFEHYFPAAGQVIVRASPGDATESQLYRVSLKPPFMMVPLTSGHAVHSVVSEDRGPLAVSVTESAAGEARYEVIGAQGSLNRQIPSKAEIPGAPPLLEFTTAGDRAFNAVIIRSRQVKANEYPIIVNVYGGPHTQMVRKQPSLYFLDQWIADQGYVVVAIDGRGTPNRGRDWERAIKGNLIDVSLNDQADALKVLFARYPEMDAARVGIFGWSFGGYFTAMAVTQRPDLFSAGVAGAPVTDWHDYDTYYTERYMGLPDANPDGYRASSVLTHASELQRPLLLIHGTSDDNVYFMHSLKLSEALFRAGKDFQFLPLAGFTHMVPDPVVMQRMYGRIMSFFREKLAAPREAGRP